MPESENANPVVLSILMPVRNEGVNIPIMLKLLRAAVDTPHEVLIIYDHPDDNSVPAAQAIQSRYPELRLIYNDLGRGILNALRKGVESARGKYVLVSCVDEVGPLLAIDDMVALLDSGCDLVSGTRYRWGGRRLGGSAIGAMLSFCANLLMRACGSSLSDVTTGLKMFKRPCFEQLKLESKPVGWVVAIEIGIKAQLHGFKLGEVPIVSLDRLYGGESTFQMGPWMAEYFKWFLWGAKQFLFQKERATVAVRIPAIVSPTTSASAKAVNPALRS